MGDKTCKERIKGQLSDRMKSIDTALDLAAKGIEETGDGEGVDNIREGILSIDKNITVYVLLSTGGPEDGFEFDLDSENKEITGGRYVFKDWFDGAKQELSEDELEQVLDAYALDYYGLMGE